jgi:hypothetical protein
VSQAVMGHQVSLRVRAIAAWLAFRLEQVQEEEQQQEQEGCPALGRQALMRPLSIAAWLEQLQKQGHPVPGRQGQIPG